MNENILARKKDLLVGIEYALKGYKCSIRETENDISIQFGKDIVIGVAVEENGYSIYNISDEWAKETTYFVETDDDGTKFYYLDSIDECVGEIERLAEVETKKIILPIVNDGTLLSAFRSIEDQYPDLVFSRVNAKGKEVKKAVYIYPKNAAGKGKVIFEIWNLKNPREYSLFMKREYLTNAEYEESKRESPKDTTGKRGVIKRVFETEQELIDFMILRLNKVARQ